MVLRALFHADEPVTGRELERRTGLSNRATMMALDSLLELAAVTCEQTAQANWYELNRDHYFVAKALKPAFDAEDLFWDDVRKTIRRVVHPRPIAAVATGALARDEMEDGGRLDLIMVFSNGRSRLRAFRQMEVLEEEIWTRYALAVGSTLIDVSSADDDEYDALWRRVEREGILLYGTLP